MGLIGGHVGYQILRTIGPRRNQTSETVASIVPDPKLKQFFGNDFGQAIQGRTIIDFGCGIGDQAVSIALIGAGKVIGLDIQEKWLSIARKTAQQFSVSDRCTFVTGTDELADIILSKDAFEHYSDPAATLRRMSSLLKPDGFVLAAFGPTWLHPYGGHLFSVFPWAHLLFSERALIRWRSDFKYDGARRFSEVEGGLNQITIRKFERIVGDSPLKLEWLDTVPIKGARFLKSRVFREVGSSIVRCKLTLR